MRDVHRRANFRAPGLLSLPFISLFLISHLSIAQSTQSTRSRELAESQENSSIGAIMNSSISEQIAFEQLVARLTPSLAKLTKIYLSTEIDSERFSRFVRIESKAIKPLIRAIDSMNGTEPPDQNCQLIFNSPGVVSRVSSINLKEIGPDESPTDWIKKLDRLQCELCQRIKNAGLGENAARGIDQHRVVILDYILAKEFQAATSGDEK